VLVDHEPAVALLERSALSLSLSRFSTETWNAGKWVNADFDRERKKYYSVRAILEDAPVTVLLHVNEQKIFHKYVKGFQMIPAGLINMHSVWLDRA
jgi:hypothetical protein